MPRAASTASRLGQVAAARAEALQPAQPALGHFDQALSPEQKAMLDRPMDGERHHGWRRHEFRHQLPWE